MFGIDDPGIWSAYALMVMCLIFAIVFSIKTWNKEDTPENE